MVVKFKIVPRQRHQHTELVNVGFSRNTISSQTRLLGVDFCDRLNTAGRRTAIDRVAAAELQAQKLCLVTSLPPKTKHMLWRTRVVPKACWGCFF
jgi:hypothetical protein